MNASPRSDAAGENLAITGKTLLLTGLWLGLAVSLSDAVLLLLCRLIGSGGESAPASLLLRPLAGTLLLTLVVYLLLWFVLARPLSRILKLDTLPAACGLAALIYAFYLAIALFGRIRQTGDLALETRFSIELVKAAALAAVVVAAIAALYASRALARSPRRAAAAGLCLSFPLLLLEAYWALWLDRAFFAAMEGIRLPVKELLTTPSILVIPGFAAAAAVTLVFFARSGKSERPAQLLTGLALAGVAGSIIVLFLVPGGDLRASDAATDDRVREGHPVKHVVLIVIDTLRMDALSCCGGEVPTPHIDALAADGLLFSRSQAAASWTVPSMTTLLTGLSPSVHGAIRYDSMVPFEVETLGEHMQESGYLTHAIGSQPFMAGREDFAQGFHGYDFYPKKRDESLLGWIRAALSPEAHKAWASTDDLTVATLSWLEDNASKDFFLWTHFYDPHMPYTPPAEYLPEGNAPPGMGARFTGPLKSVRAGYLTPTREQREWIRALYDGEVRHVDASVGRIVAGMKKLGIYDDSLIVLTSDHGEEFWEHDGFEHGHSLYNELLSVPLLVKLPNCDQKGIVEIPVVNEQVLPSILDICKIDYVSENLTNRSLPGLNSKNHTKIAPDPIVSTGVLYYENRESVIFEGMKYIRSLISGREEVYDLTRDPGEKENIVATAQAVVDEARNILDQHEKEAARLKGVLHLIDGRGTTMDAEALQSLKSMGYLE